MSPDHPKSEKQRLRAEELMNAALRLFADRGFAPVTIQDIAKSVPVNSALIYY
jgi:AcrR family transcriptional regulator